MVLCQLHNRGSLHRGGCQSAGTEDSQLVSVVVQTGSCSGSEVVAEVEMGPGLDLDSGQLECVKQAEYAASEMEEAVEEEAETAAVDESAVSGRKKEPA